jgi:hypothetical protein
MAVYFFDTRDDGDVSRDEIGVECPDLEAAKAQAVKGLAELAVDLLPGSTRRVLGIDVRDQSRQGVLVTELVFEARVLMAPDDGGLTFSTNSLRDGRS